MSSQKKGAPQPKKKQPAPAPAAAKKSDKKKAPKKDYRHVYSHLFKKSPKVLKVGRDLPPKRDLSRVVLWPAYIRLQRQRAILKKRLKVPPAIHQLSKTVQGGQAKELFSLLKAHRPESPEDKAKRLKAKAAAEAKQEGSAQVEDKKPIVLKYGLNHVTTLIEQKKAKLVVIAHDVDPVELVVWLPALCRKMDVPYCIVKGKARLGHLVYKKQASVVALVDVQKQHAQTLQNLIQTLRIVYNDNVSSRTEWGGGIMGHKFETQKKKWEKVKARAEAGKKK